VSGAPLPPLLPPRVLVRVLAQLVVPPPAPPRPAQLTIAPLPRCLPAPTAEPTPFLNGQQCVTVNKQGVGVGRWAGRGGAGSSNGL
jgi:hypothetical protein